MKHDVEILISHSVPFQNHHVGQQFADPDQGGRLRQEQADHDQAWHTIVNQDPEQADRGERQ